jgi:flavin-dependent dehydrogenase
MSNGPKSITIIGGGLAGLTLGIGLRRHDIPVSIWEAGRYPRHRVCGEFISGKGQAVLGRMGLLDHFRRAGATLAHSTRFFLGSSETRLRQIEPPALCLSRFTMDKLLADLFQTEGGELRQSKRWEDKGEGEGIIRASGRHAHTRTRAWRWFGLKAHANKVELSADLEMHSVRNGYVGLCRLADSKVNVCGLFRAQRGVDGTSARQLLRGESGTALRQRLATAQFDEASFCSTAGLCLQPQQATGQTDCRVGDALTMIPPVTGNGMSMAFEAAELAIEPIRAYACDGLPWSTAREAVAHACDAAFRDRLVWAKRLQAMMFSPVVCGTVGAKLLNSRWLWQLVFTRTR